MLELVKEIAQVAGGNGGGWNGVRRQRMKAKKKHSNWAKTLVANTVRVDNRGILNSPIITNGISAKFIGARRSKILCSESAKIKTDFNKEATYSSQRGIMP